MEKKKHSIFNVFDIVVILIAVALAAVLFFTRSSGSSTSDDAADTKSGTVTYTVELTGMVNGSAELVSVGDELVDKVKKYDVGTVKAVEVSNTVRQVQDLVNGGTVESEMSTQQTATVTVEAPCTETEADILVAGGYPIKVGLQVSLKGPGYYGTGYIVGVERGE